MRRCVHTRQKETTNTLLPKHHPRSPHTASRVTRNRLPTRKNKRRYGDDRRRHRRGGSAHGFSALHGQVENPLSPQRVVTYRVPSRKLRVTFKKTTVSNSHACTSMRYIAISGAKISIYLPDVRKNILLYVAVPFFFYLFFSDTTLGVFFFFGESQGSRRWQGGVLRFD